jgi:hypothetical protein
MKKIKLPSIKLSGLFKREKFDPIEMPDINEPWDKNTASNVTPNTVSASGKFQNEGFLEKAKDIEERLKAFDEGLKSLKQ